MLEQTLTTLNATLDRVADALERLLAIQENARTVARVEALERKTAAIVDESPAPTTVAEAIRQQFEEAGKIPQPSEPAAAAPTITHDTLRALGKEIITRDGGKPGAFKAVLKELGAGNVSEIKPEQMEECARRLKEVLGQ